MAKEILEFTRRASPIQVADYLDWLALGLKRGDVSLDSGKRALRLVPPPELKLGLRVRERNEEGRLSLKISWKDRAAK